ncbi:MAG: HAD-IA family hydrolase [Alphaproteobacteria bacterium]|nr:HAD-IA family hydrolase [Alphaproteobacteria bacterium]
MKTIQDIELVIFDCDGTLVDSEYVNNRSISKMLTDLGHTKFTTKYCIDYFAGCSIHDVINTLKRLKVENPEKKLEEMHVYSMQIAKDELKAIDNVRKTLEQITIPKCVASNGENRIVLDFLNITKLIGFFASNAIFTREMVARPKPEGDLYLHAAKQMNNVDPSKCLVIEDSIVGVMAGKKAGMNVIGFIGANHHHEKSENQLLTAGAFTTVKDFSEILKYIPQK